MFFPCWQAFCSSTQSASGAENWPFWGSLFRSASNCWLTKLLTKVGDKDFCLGEGLCVCVCVRVCPCILAVAAPTWRVCLFRWLLHTNISVCVMRGCETTSCLSVLSAGRHRDEQTCVSMAMSGCSPFPMCWDRGMNEERPPFAHSQTHAHAQTHTHTETSK